MAGFPSFLWTNNILWYIYMYHIFFICLSTDGRLDHFHIVVLIGLLRIVLHGDPADLPSE